MFQFSLDCSKHDLPILRKWLAHFDFVGRPAAIIKAGHDRFAYSVWREGKRIVTPQAGTTETDTLAKGSEIVESVRGFNLKEKP